LQQETVRLVDLAEPQRLARATKLGTGREHGHARAPPARDSDETGGGESAELRRAEPRAPRDDNVACSHIAPARAHARASASSFRNRHLVVMFDNILDGDDGIGALGHDASRRDRHCLARPEHTGGGTPRSDPTDHAERSRRVRGPHREPIHRRTRERR
jgi:hypothetical protein